MSQFLFHQHHYIYYIQLKSSIPSIICTYFFLIASQLHRHRFSGSEPLNHWTVPPWKKRRVSKTVMGLGTHLDQLGGDEFQHNPCSDERINIPLAMDIAAFEIHVIQLMMGSFIFLFDLCFFSRDSSSSTGLGMIWAHFAPRSQAELRKDVVTFSSVCQRPILRKSVMGNVGFQVGGIWKFYLWNLVTTLDLKVRKPKTLDLGFTHNQCQCH